MRLAQKGDIPAISDLLVRAYQENPTVLRLIGPKADAKARMRTLFAISIADLIKINAVHITDNGAGIAVIYSIADKAPNLLSQLKLVVKVTGLKRGLQALKRENLIKKIRPKGDYLHFWMLAVDPEIKGIETIQEMRDFAFMLSKTLKKPIYAETPLPRTKLLYERYGFTTYDSWQDGDYTIWFLKREADV